MKIYLLLSICTVFSIALTAQENQRPSRPGLRPAVAGAQTGTNAARGYAADVAVVHDAQEQALEQARQMLEEAETARDRTALGAAIKEMERAQAALEQAKNLPEKLSAAIAAEQSAYQTLLKLTPREYRMTRQQRSGSQSGGQSQSQQRQMDQLEMQREENRYETERQATAPPNAQQREQLQTADRLKELAQRQQDLNERLRELQNALQAARTEQAREEVQRQLKRLRDEQRQMLASVDELRQQLAESPNAGSQAEARQQLDQTRSDMERAAQEMEQNSASQALAAGTRAQQQMQNLREDLRRQTSSQFAEEMRQMRNEARELARQQEEIAKGLESLNNADHQALNNSAERQQIARQMERQQSSLTNLLGGMRNVTERAETTEPLLSQKLYDTLRRADQLRTDNLLEMGTQLVERGFLPQASQVERSARTNITELAKSVERAAESVLGSEAEALRYAQKELEDLARQMEREMAGAGTNAAARSAGGAPTGERGTNSMAGANGSAAGGESQQAGNNSPGQQPGEGNSGSAAQGGNQSGQANTPGSNGQQASGQGQQPGGNNPGSGNRGQQASGNGSSGEPTPGEGQQTGQGQAAAGNNGQGGSRGGNNSQQQATQPGQAGQAQNEGGGGSGSGGGNSLRRFAEELGRGNRSAEGGSPITGNGFVNWSDRLRDVEQVLDSPDLRNQLATVRERASALRGEFRDRGQRPPGEAVREQILAPLSQVRVWVQEELKRRQNSDSLVPLDRDPVPEVYSELVRKYYEKLGSAQ